MGCEDHLLDEIYDPEFEELKEYNDEVVLKSGRYVEIKSSRYVCGHTERGSRMDPDEFVYDRVDDPEWVVSLLNDDGEPIEGELTKAEKDEVSDIVWRELAVG